mgnify:CR=1 FL=1
MIIIALSVILSFNTLEEIKQPEMLPNKVEARKRGKGHRGRRRGGSGLR